MTQQDIIQRLNELHDDSYADFQCRLIPDVNRAHFIGVRTPKLRSFAKELGQDLGKNAFMNSLPHHTFDENQLHAFLIAGEKDFDVCMTELKTFLPYIDNWATCDQLTPKVFGHHQEELLPHIRLWIKDSQTYTVRFGVEQLMKYYLKEAYDPSYPAMVSALRSEQYYVNMMIAWYFATALAIRYDDILPYLQNESLDLWTHNKTIQKAVESYRITAVQKQYLKSLRR